MEHLVPVEKTSVNESPRPIRAYLRVYGSAVARPWLNRDVARSMKLLAEIEQLVELPYPQCMDRIAILDTLSRDKLAIRLQVASEAETRLLQIGLTLEQHQATHSKLPMSLEAFADVIPSGTLIDPYSGHQFVHDAASTPFQLYSVGNNMIDDGGRHDTKDGDIVWRGKQINGPDGEIP